MLGGKAIASFLISFICSASIAATGVVSSTPATGFGDQIYCFKAVEKKYNDGFPEVICINDLVASKNNDGQDLLTLVGPKSSTQTSNIVWADYDSFIVTATFEKFVDYYVNCGENVEADLAVRFQQSIYGGVDNWNNVVLTLKYQETRDNCHSDWNEGKLDYLPMF